MAGLAAHGSVPFGAAAVRRRSKPTVWIRTPSFCAVVTATSSARSAADAGTRGASGSPAPPSHSKSSLRSSFPTSRRTPASCGAVSGVNPKQTPMRVLTRNFGAFVSHTRARRKLPGSPVPASCAAGVAPCSARYIARTPARSSSSTWARDASAAGVATTFGCKRRAMVTARRTSASRGSGGWRMKTNSAPLAPAVASRSIASRSHATSSAASSGSASATIAGPHLAAMRVFAPAYRRGGSMPVSRGSTEGWYSRPTRLVNFKCWHDNERGSRTAGCC